MKRLLSSIIAIGLMMSATPRANAQDLKRLSLDDASSIGLRLVTDTRVKIEGAASLRIETKWPTSVCLGEVSG